MQNQSANENYDLNDQNTKIYDSTENGAEADFVPNKKEPKHYFAGMEFVTKGRIAGALYFLLVLTGIFHLRYVPSQIIVSGDTASTVNNIVELEYLFRSGIVVGILSYTLYLLLPLVLFDVFKDVNRRMAIAMVALALVSVPVSLCSMVDRLNILTLISGADFLNALSTEYIETQVMLLLKSYSNSIRVVQIFWGLWLFPLGYLIYKSAYIPRIIGIFLMLGCFGYLTLFFSKILFPTIVLPGIVSIPASIGELSTCFWLLIMGIKQPNNQKPSTT